MTKVTPPDGSFLSYTYDAAHRLTDVVDSAGNTIHYTMDLLGNRLKEEVKDPQGNIKRTQSQVFDVLNRVEKIKNAAGDIVTQFEYDDRGVRKKQIDHIDASLTATTTFTPDVLNRIKESKDPLGADTKYGFNALDQLVNVTDPKGLVTDYTINAFGEVTRQLSPDTGETNYEYDAAGNRTKQSDDRDVVVDYQYDALTRLTKIDYDGIAEDVVYTYDSTAQSYGKGRLTGIEDASGTTTLIYDRRGNVLEEQRLISGTTYTTTYTYDSADRVTSIEYPSHRLVSYTRNALGQITQVDTKVGTVITTLAQDIEYLPFGGIKSYTLGNGVVVTRTHDQNYRLTDIKDQGNSTLQELSLEHDRRGNIELIQDLQTPSRTQDFSYDELSRVVSAAGAYGLHGFTYDAVGNRLTQGVTVGGSTTTDTYAYPDPVTSHRLSSQTSGPSYGYDAAGNATNNGTLGMTYNQANRLATVTGGSAAVTNVYSANGQRVKKTANGVTTIFHYDRTGQLIAEGTDSGLYLGREYVWLQDIPLAVMSERRIPDFYVDNVDSGFSSVGAWSPDSATGQYGASYLKRGPATELPGEAVVDNPDAGASYSGTWLPGGGSCTGLLCPPLLNSVVSSEAPYGTPATYHRSDTSGARVFTWQTPATGRYRVYVRWVPLEGAGAATYAVAHAGGTAVHTVDQSLSSNGWYALGGYEFGGTATITLTPDAGMVGIADAVRLVAIENTDSNIATWEATGEPGKYEVFGRWPSVGGTSSAAPFSVIDSLGTTALPQDQSTGGGLWNSLGDFESTATNNIEIELRAVWDANVLADAMHFVPVAAESLRTHLAYFHVDQLNTPQKLSDQSQAIVWEAFYEPFGKATITKQQHFDNPLRFAGQYEDAETRLYQNWFRDYCPECGRYLQSDPIGIEGGLSTYGYADQNPLSRIDPLGLYTEIIAWQPYGGLTPNSFGSSFGHVSGNINGENFSWAPPGAWDRRTADEYIRRQQEFRSGAGVILALTPKQEAELAACLRKTRGDYGAITDNCGTPFKDCLSMIGIDIGYPLFPADIGDALLNSPLNAGTTFYPGPERGFLENILRGDMPDAPWAR